MTLLALLLLIPALCVAAADVAGVLLAIGRSRIRGPVPVAALILRNRSRAA